MTTEHRKDFDNGLATRKKVMGEDFVANAFGAATDFTLPMQHYITRNAWGDVWQRPGLDLKTRSLITVAMLTALGKQHELKGHVRGALNNGVTAEEIQEVLLHASVYCGVPSAVEAFRSAAEVVDGPKKA